MRSILTATPESFSGALTMPAIFNSLPEAQAYARTMMSARVEAVLDIVFGFVAAAALLAVLLGVWWLPVILQMS